MFKKTFTSFLLFIYLVVSSLSFADEAIIEIITESPVVSDMSTSSEIPQEITKEQNIAPETIINNIIPANSDNTASEISDSAGDILHKDTSSDVLGDNNSITLPSAPEDIQATENEGLNTAEILSGELLPTTEEIPTTEPVMVEENSIFTPPGPEPEPWQPAVIVDPTTDNVPVGNTETQSDPQFLAENSVFVRRMVEEVVVDKNAQHSCKVDVFHTDVSEQPTGLLSVHFYGTSLLASYDAEIGSLPNGIDVRFEKNNDYIYDFRGKETTLELIVTKQDTSLEGDFTIPIIYTYKGKKESSVICQLNIINEEERVPVSGIVPTEPVRDPAQEFVIHFLEEIPPRMTLGNTPEELIESLVPTSVPSEDIPVPTMENHDPVVTLDSIPIPTGNTPEELIESLVPTSTPLDNTSPLITPSDESSL